MLFAHFFLCPASIRIELYICLNAIQFHSIPNMLLLLTYAVAISDSISSESWVFTCSIYIRRNQLVIAHEILKKFKAYAIPCSYSSFSVWVSFPIFLFFFFHWRWGGAKQSTQAVGYRLSRLKSVVKPILKFMFVWLTSKACSSRCFDLYAFLISLHNLPTPFQHK